MKIQFWFFPILITYQKKVRIKSGQTLIKVQLEPKTNILSEVEIAASKKLAAVKIRDESIVDFAITNNFLFLLAWEGSQKYQSLQVLHLQTDSLLVRYKLPVYAKQLYVDCLSNLHVLTENKAYQVYFADATVKLYPAAPKAEFDRVLLPCLATDSLDAYFRYGTNKGIIVSFYAVNQQNQQSELIRTIQDEEVLKMQADEVRFQDSRSGKLMKDPEMNMNRTEHTAANSIAFAQQVMFQPPYFPLLKAGSEICLFDHVNGKIEFYQNAKLSRVVSVKYHLQKNWVKEILLDSGEGNVYIQFKKNGINEIRALNLKTGVLENSYKIAHPFPGQIAVHNSMVYYLLKDPAKNNRSYLYKAHLSSLRN